MGLVRRFFSLLFFFCILVLAQASFFVTITLQFCFSDRYTHFEYKLNIEVFRHVTPQEGTRRKRS